VKRITAAVANQNMSQWLIFVLVQCDFCQLQERSLVIYLKHDVRYTTEVGRPLHCHEGSGKNNEHLKTQDNDSVTY
jgi:hypothetical protein